MAETNVKPETVLITGVTGLLGGRLAEKAMDRGLAVRSLARREWEGPPHVPPSGRFLGDLPDGIPAACMAGADTVFHCAGTDAGGDARVYAVNHRGSVNLAELAAACGVRTFVYVSSSSARPDALSAYGLSKYRAEGDIAAMERIGPVIVRPNLIVGGGSGIFERMCKMADSLPVLPFLGGGVTIVQPVHVDDLCEALLRAAGMASQLKGRILNIGDPEGLSLRDLLQAICVARHGKRKPGISVPLWPARLAVRAAGVAGLRLPINESNLKGLERVEHIPTRQDLETLGISLRPLPDSLKPQGPVDSPDADRKARALRIVVVGAGRMGLMHCILISRLKGAVLAGVVEKSRKAVGMLRGIGIKAPAFREMREAWELKPDGIVVATPPSSHLALAREALERNCAVFVEKPLAVGEEQSRAYADLLARSPGAPIQDGYVMRRLPHVRSWIDDLKSGRLGKPLGFSGSSLAGIKLGKGDMGWQGDKSVSGGGALISLGSHLLSVIYDAFGIPLNSECETAALHSRGVEDSAIVKFEYEGFSGRVFASWSVPGRARAEHSLAIRLENGVLILEGPVGIFIRPDGNVEIRHQLDYEVGFNMAPDFAGAGFSRELEEFFETIRAGRDGGGSAKALEMERDLFGIYARAREVSRFGSGAWPGAVRADGGTAPSVRGEAACRLVLDCREAGPTAIEQLPADAKWVHVQVFPRQFRTAAGVDPERVRVTMPDFMSLSRHLAAGDFLGFLREIGFWGVAGAVRAAIPAVIRNKGADFWAAAEAMLAAEAARIPGNFEGWAMLHPYLTDLALSLRAPERIERLTSVIERALPRARVGLHTNMLLEAEKEMHRLEKVVAGVSFLSSPGAPGMERVIAERPQIEWTAEVGPGPDMLHREASANPEAWAHGAESVMIGAAADPRLAALRRTVRDRGWAAAFPGAEPDPV